MPGPAGLVDVFRPSGQTPDIARQAVAAGATALWLQLGKILVEGSPDEIKANAAVREAYLGGVLE